MGYFYFLGGGVGKVPCTSYTQNRFFISVAAKLDLVFKPTVAPAWYKGRTFLYPAKQKR